MGYYSGYTIEVEDRRPPVKQAIAKLRREIEGAKYSINNEGKTQERSTWYSWQEDMVEFSRLNPDILFTVKRVGEESPDVEVGYFLNGEHQGGKAEVRFPDFVEPEGE